MHLWCVCVFTTCVAYTLLCMYVHCRAVGDWGVAMHHTLCVGIPYFIYVVKYSNSGPPWWLNVCDSMACICQKPKSSQFQFSLINSQSLLHSLKCHPIILLCTYLPIPMYSLHACIAYSEIVRHDHTTTPLHFYAASTVLLHSLIIGYTLFLVCTAVSPFTWRTALCIPRMPKRLVTPRSLNGRSHFYLNFQY